MDENEKQKSRKYVVMDVVFYGGSLNYDQGATNYQELKKITKWDGRQYVLVSRYALRYSILHWANKLYPNDWKLAGKEEFVLESGGVVHPKPDMLENKKILDFPEFDLFGFMIAEKKNQSTEKKEKTEKGTKEAAVTRVSPVKISHAISLTPYNHDSHFMANLDVTRRAGGSGSNPVTIEEKEDFYAYSVVIDADRIGKYTKDEHGDEKIGDITIDPDVARTRIVQLVEAILYLKREIKGRMEDLSPWLVICGLYAGGKYDTYSDRIELEKSHIYKIITKEKEGKDEEGRVIKEIERQTVEKDAPRFRIEMEGVPNPKEVDRDTLIDSLGKFLGEGSSNQLLVYKRPSVEMTFVPGENAKKT